MGHVRIKYDSSSGGDNGIKSIINHLGNKEFYQYKVGISNDKNRDTKDYVLGKFSNEEMIILNEIIDKSKDIIEDFIVGKITNTNWSGNVKDVNTGSSIYHTGMISTDIYNQQ